MPPRRSNQLIRNGRQCLRHTRLRTRCRMGSILGSRKPVIRINPAI